MQHADEDSSTVQEHQRRLQDYKYEIRWVVYIKEGLHDAVHAYTPKILPRLLVSFLYGTV